MQQAAFLLNQAFTEILRREYTALHDEFVVMPVLALFIALAGGFIIGRIPFGNFKIGGVAGSLIAGILVSLFGAQIDASVKSLLFALFIFAIGFDSGPQFFRCLGKNTLREVFMSLSMVCAAFLTVVAVAKVFGFEKGLTIGIAAGGLTQSPMVGVASDALAKMGFAPDVLNAHIADIGVGYAITYVFGTLGPVIVCTAIVPKFMGKSIKDAALEEETKMSQIKALNADESLALDALVGRVYRMDMNTFTSVAEIESSGGEFPVTVEKVKRGNSFLHIRQNLKFKHGDILLLVGRREALVPLEALIGPELTGVFGINLIMKTQEVILNNADFTGLPLKELLGGMKSQIRHGVYVLSVSRGGKDIILDAEERLTNGDMLKLYGSEEDVEKAVGVIGIPIIPSAKTDVLLMCLGIIAGLLVGMLTLNIAGIPLTLGSGGGVLLSGLLTGWLKSKRPQLGGTIPSAASELLKDLSSAGFVAAVGLNSGAQALNAIHQNGAAIVVGGLFVTFVPLFVCMLIGRFVLRYKNTAIFAGALSGARNSNPALVQVISLAGNSVPSMSFAVAYGLSNVFMILLGPILAAII